jgi:5-methylcytosine-specific restriction endonuclease McrA
VKAATIEYFNQLLKKRKLDSFLLIIDIQNDEILLVRDSEYGDYKITTKNLTSVIPLHKKRKHNQNLLRLKEKYVGKEIKEGIKIIDIFYGPDHGYKNRSFYFNYIGACGHRCINTYATLTKHIKTFKCTYCSSNSFIHGERKKGLPRRTYVYTSWLSIKSKLDKKYHDFICFRDELGEKPSSYARIIEIDGKPVWNNLEQISTDQDINLISSAIRQAFRYSKKYKECKENARVETNEGIRYQCAVCKNLFKSKQIQVDHISPIQPLDGSKLTRDGLIEKIWDSPIQILDRQCHSKKTCNENSIRREARNDQIRAYCQSNSAA